MAKEILLEIHFAKHKTQFDKLPDGTNSLISFVSERIPSQYSHFLNLNINNLLTESEGCTGKYQLTEVLLCWPSDIEVNTAKTRFDIFPYSPNSRGQ